MVISGFACLSDSPRLCQLQALVKRGVMAIALLACVSIPVAHTDTLHVHDRIIGKPLFDKFAPAFERETGFKLRFHVLEFPVYEHAEDSLIYGEPIDMVALYPTLVVRFAEAGWIRSLEQSGDFDLAEEKMYESARVPIQHKGEIYAASQFSAGLAVPLVDMDRLDALGMTRADFANSWSELNRQVVDLAEAGHKGLYFPFWFDEGIGLSIAFIAEVLNRGGHVVEPDLHTVAMSPGRGPAFDTLSDWRELVTSGAVDMSVMGMTFREAIASFAVGEHLYSAFTVDALLRAKKTGRKMTVLPRADHDWGIMGSVAYGIVLDKSESEARRLAKRKLLQLYTRGLQGKRFVVARELLSSIGYFSPYKDYMEGEEALSIIRSRLSYPEDVPELMDVFENLQYPVGEWGVQWATEFNLFLRGELQSFLKNENVSPSEVIISLNNKINELRRSYGY